jgi:TolB-like protein/Tfp pilus assembly protein PilF/tRNA A-37 threonylcarbamoyl transferase component Bud32
MAAVWSGRMTDVLARLRDALADRYPIERVLGRGGTATVYLARDVKHQRPVAVKVLHPQLAAGLGTDRFLREIRIEAALQHPHILPLHDSGEADGFLYYVMPFVAGESLRERLRRAGPLPLDEVLRVTGDIAEALGYAHEHGVVHRDIKPENILLSNGHALVADFGIAKAMAAAGDEKLTETGWGMGTPAYMSPEQIVGAPADARADVYGLGCVVYEMLCGTPPFPGDNAREMFARHQQEPPPRLRQARPDLPEHVEVALRTALAKDPDDRYATAPELVRGLSGAPPLARRKRAGPFPGSRAGMVGISILLLVGAGALAARRWTSADGPRTLSVGVVPIENLDLDSSQAYLSEGLTEELGTRLAGIRKLRVISRRTMQVLGARGMTAAEIGRELGLDAVVTGSLQRVGDSVRMTAQLVGARDDRAIWAGSFGGTRADLLRMQREVAWSVGEKLVGHSGERRDTSVGDPAAVDAYVRGRYWWGKRNGPALLQSIRFFGQALDADPRFAPAYAGMADAYMQLGYQSLLAPDDAFPKAAAAARKALELDSSLAEPRATLAYYNLYYAWNWPAAEREFRLALARNPSYATGHEWYGLFLTAMGRFDEALAEERLAQQLDPLSPAVTATAGWVLHYRGRQDEAERILRQVLRADSGFGLGRFYLGRVLQAKGAYDSAAAQYDRMAGALRGWVPTLAALANLYADMGRRDEARAILRHLDSLSAHQYVTSYAVAVVHAALASPDSAFHWLDRAIRERTHWVVWLNRDPRWKPLRGDPRFLAAVRKVGLPP